MYLIKFKIKKNEFLRIFQYNIHIIWIEKKVEIILIHKI